MALPLVAMVEPPLTTVRISCGKYEEAARLLVRENETPDLAPERMVALPELALRCSMSAPRPSMKKTAPDDALHAARRTPWLLVFAALSYTGSASSDADQLHTY